MKKIGHHPKTTVTTYNLPPDIRSRMALSAIHTASIFAKKSGLKISQGYKNMLSKNYCG